MRYFVKTLEEVEGTYSVEAASEEDARSAFPGPFSDGPDIDWDRVVQLEYLAFSCEVNSVKEAES